MIFIIDIKYKILFKHIVKIVKKNKIKINNQWTIHQLRNLN